LKKYAEFASYICRIFIFLAHNSNNPKHEYINRVSELLLANYAFTTFITYYFWSKMWCDCNE